MLILMHTGMLRFKLPGEQRILFGGSKIKTFMDLQTKCYMNSTTVSRLH